MILQCLLGEVYPDLFVVVFEARKTDRRT